MSLTTGLNEYSATPSSLLPPASTCDVEPDELDANRRDEEDAPLVVAIEHNRPIRGGLNSDGTNYADPSVLIALDLRLKPLVSPRRQHNPCHGGVVEGGDELVRSGDICYEQRGRRQGRRWQRRSISKAAVWIIDR